jgi:predicted MFS family arabinose efflux permease
MPETMEEPKSPDSVSYSLWQLTAAGFCSNLVCLGLARFGYGPLLPAIIDAHWFDASGAAYLGAANLAGYLLGALASHQLAIKISPLWLLRIMMLLAGITFFGCAWPLDFAWFFLWRFLSGVAGGVVVVLSMTTILPHVGDARRGIASGAMFMGVGTGIVASGTLIPVFIRHGLTETWIGLGAISCLLTFLVWRSWPDVLRSNELYPGGRPAFPGSMHWLYAKYALNAFALIPHMIFLVAYVADGLGQGLDVGAHYWILFGLGAIVGPILTGRLGDLLGFRRALRITLFLETIVIGLPVLAPGPIALIVSSIYVGAFTPGIVPLVLGRIYELAPNERGVQQLAWSIATACFAIFQAAGAYFMSFVFSRVTGAYLLLFAVGASACGLALMIDLSESLLLKWRRNGA